MQDSAQLHCRYFSLTLQPFLMLVVNSDLRQAVSLVIESRHRSYLESVQYFVLSSIQRSYISHTPTNIRVIGASRRAESVVVVNRPPVLTILMPCEENSEAENNDQAKLSLFL